MADRDRATFGRAVLFQPGFGQEEHLMELDRNPEGVRSCTGQKRVPGLLAASGDSVTFLAFFVATRLTQQRDQPVKLASHN